MMTDAHETNDAETLELLGGLTLQPASRHLKVDVAAYTHFLDGEDLTESEKQALVATLWSVIVRFVELGFGVSPLNEIERDPAEEGSENAPQTGTDRVHLNHPPNTKPEETNRREAAEEREDS